MKHPKVSFILSAVAQLLWKLWSDAGTMPACGVKTPIKNSLHMLLILQHKTNYMPYSYP